MLHKYEYFLSFGFVFPLFLFILLAPKKRNLLDCFSFFLFLWEMNAPLCTNTATLIYLPGRYDRVVFCTCSNSGNVESGEIVAIKLRLRLVALWHAHLLMGPRKTHKHFGR